MLGFGFASAPAYGGSAQAPKVRIRRKSKKAAFAVAANKKRPSYDDPFLFVWRGDVSDSELMLHEARSGSTVRRDYSGLLALTLHTLRLFRAAFA